MNIHPQIIEKEGKKEFVVISYDEFLAIQSVMEDYEDLKVLRETKSSSKKSERVLLSEIRDELLQEG